MTDCTFFDPLGNVTKRWAWPRLLKERVDIRLGERIHVTLIDQNNIITKLKVLKNGKVSEFECGRAASSAGGKSG